MNRIGPQVYVGQVLSRRHSWLTWIVEDADVIINRRGEDAAHAVLGGRVFDWHFNQFLWIRHDMFQQKRRQTQRIMLWETPWCGQQAATKLGAKTWRQGENVTKRKQNGRGCDHVNGLLKCLRKRRRTMDARAASPLLFFTVLINNRKKKWRQSGKWRKTHTQKNKEIAKKIKKMDNSPKVQRTLHSDMWEGGGRRPSRQNSGSTRFPVSSRMHSDNWRRTPVPHCAP